MVILELIEMLAKKIQTFNCAAELTHLVTKWFVNCMQVMNFKMCELKC